VAIVQVSRITHRKGLKQDLPEPLASAELGWAVDERKLYIGNGTIAEGAPVVGNTEILTEFSDILSFQTQYTYKGENAGYTAQTGSTPGAPVTQSLQSRLDSFAVISDFGASGDGTTDVTSSINRALFQIFCRSEAPQTRRSLFFPAGEYIITDTLKIPTNAAIYGEGIDSTIINLRVLNWNENVVWAAGVLVFNPGDDNYYRSLQVVPSGTDITDGNFWNEEALPEYIIRTADSLQRIGEDIATGGGKLPNGISVSGIKFKTNRDINGALVEKASNCVFDTVGFEGAAADATTAAALTGLPTSAVAWNSVTGQPCSNVLFNNCEFSGFGLGTGSNQNIRAVTISNCNFDSLGRGVELGDTEVENGGPTGVRIVQNVFDRIVFEGVVIKNVSLNATAYNTFYDVGNDLTGTTLPNNTTPLRAIIQLDADNNISVGDSFLRNNEQSKIHPRIALNNSSSIALGMNVEHVNYFQANVQANTIAQVDTVANSIDLGTYKRLAGISNTLFDNQTNGTLVEVVTGANKINAFKIDYTIIRGASYRTGTLTVASGSGFSYSDDFVENANTGITLTPTPGTGKVTVSYSSTSTGETASIKYSISTLG
jgi:hypothetical protein